MSRTAWWKMRKNWAGMDVPLLPLKIGETYEVTDELGGTFLAIYSDEECLVDLETGEAWPEMPGWKYKQVSTLFLIMEDE